MFKLSCVLWTQIDKYNSTCINKINRIYSKSIYWKHWNIALICKYNLFQQNYILL